MLLDELRERINEKKKDIELLEGMINYIKGVDKNGIMPDATLERKINRAYDGLVYEITYDGMPDFKLVINFMPLLLKYDLLDETEPFLLVHWQGKPVTDRNLRHFGFFSQKGNKPEDRDYKVVEFDKLECTSMCGMEFLQIPDGEINSLPSAVMLFRNCELVEEPNGNFTICDRNLSSSIDSKPVKETKKRRLTIA